jgi:hypothetical protein
MLHRRLCIVDGIDIEQAVANWMRAEYNFRLGPKAYRGDTQDMLLEAEKQLRQALTGKRQLERAYEKLKQGTR